MTRVEIRLLGKYQVLIAGQDVPLPRNKMRALLAHLAVESQRAHERSALAGLLWPDMPQRSALRNLTNTLSQVRLAFTEAGADSEFISATRQTIQFHRETSPRVDVLQMQSALASDRMAELEAGVALYQGEFLPGFSLADSSLFEEWMVQTREQLHNQVIRALHFLARHCLESKEYDRAQTYAQRQLELDPLREIAYGQLIQAQARQGQRAAALASYEKCQRVLADELGVSPSPELTDLYALLRRDSYDGNMTHAERDTDSHSAHPGDHALQLPAAYSHDTSFNNLPIQPTAFVGRESELAEIAGLLRQQDCRLVTLIGQGGMGKTRLAVEIASQLAQDFAHGVGYVSLSSLRSIDLLPNTIAQELDIAIGGSDETEQILRQLQRREMLLVLDNYEHLLAAQPNEGDATIPLYADFIDKVLVRAPHVKLLVTSRERLNLQQEWLYSVEGLAFPRTGHVEDLATYDAVVLFADRMTRVQPKFSVLAESDSVRKICRLVEGMPLGLELAASWGRFISCQEIAQEIERGLDFLETTLRNVPARHRSIRAVLDYSWRLLTDDEKLVLARLSVFQGSFTRSAATKVANSTLHALLSLVDKSLLRRREQDGRYEIHELLRQFAAEKLMDVPGEPAQTQQRHAQYYADFLETQAPHFKGEQLHTALDEIAVEIDNVRLAWSWAVAQCSVTFFQQAFFSMWMFRQFWGSEREAELSYRQAVTAFQSQSEADQASIAAQIIVGQLLMGRSYCLARLHQLEVSLHCSKQAITILRGVGAPGEWALALALLFCNYLTLARGYLHLAEQAAQESLHLYTALEDKWGVGVSAWFLGLVYERAGNFNGAASTLHTCITTFEAIGERCYLSHALSTMSRVAMARGQYGEADELLQRSLNMLNDLHTIKDQAFTAPSAGLLALESGDLQRAEALFQESLKVAEEHGERGSIFYCRNGLGYIERLRGNLEQAEQYHQACYAASQKVGWKMGDSFSLLHLGSVALARGEFDKAKTFLQESLKLSSEISMMPLAARAWIRLAYTSIALGERGEAIAWIDKTIVYGLAQQTPPFVLGALVGVAMLLDPWAQPAEAIALLALAQQQPANTYESKMVAKRRLDKMREYVPPDVVQRAEERGRTLDWAGTAQRWLQWLRAEPDAAP